MSATPTVAAQPPPAPAGVAASPGDKQVTVTWQLVSGASSYNLYWSNASGVTKISGTKVAGVTSPYLHPQLTNGLSYYYVVTAVDASNNSSVYSNEAQAAVPSP